MIVVDAVRGSDSRAALSRVRAASARDGRFAVAMMFYFEDVQLQENKVFSQHARAEAPVFADARPRVRATRSASMKDPGEYAEASDHEHPPRTAGCRHRRSFFQMRTLGSRKLMVVASGSHESCTAPPPPLSPRPRQLDARRDRESGSSGPPPPYFFLFEDDVDERQSRPTHGTAPPGTHAAGLVPRPRTSVAFLMVGFRRD